MTGFILAIKILLSLLIAYAAVVTAKDIGVEKKRTQTFNDFIGSCFFAALFIFLMFV
jgi:hypothetical protein